MPTVLLAVDACSPLERMLPAALFTASQDDSVLLGVFAQERGLLQGAALPFTIEVGSNSALCYPLTADAIGKRVLRIADDMRQRLEAAAERQQLPFEFQLCTGSISKIAIESKADVIFPGWSANSLVTTSHVRRPPKNPPANAVIVVIDDGSRSSAHAIQTARRLTKFAGTHQLVILTTLLMTDQPRAMRMPVSESEPGEMAIPVVSTEELIRQICILRPAIILLGRDQYLASDRLLQKQLTLTPCPLALVNSPL